MRFSLPGRKKEVSHDRAQEWLSSYIDARLSAEQRAELESHIAACPECSQELEALRVTRKLLRGLPPMKLPRSFTLAAAPSSLPIPRAYFILRAATAVTAGLFVALLGVSTLVPAAVGPTTGPARYQTDAAASAPSSAGGPAAKGTPASPMEALPAEPAGSASGPQPRDGAALPAQSPAPRALHGAPAAVPRSPSPAEAAAAQPAPTGQALTAPAAAKPGGMQGTPGASAAEPAIRMGETELASRVGLLRSVLLPLEAVTGVSTIILGFALGMMWWRHRPRRGR